MMEPTVIRFPEDVKRTLLLEANRKGVSLSEVVRTKVIAQIYKGKKKKQETSAEVLLRWVTKPKKYKSHYKDENLSENYKQYLYGAKSPKFGYLWKKEK